MPLNRRLDEVVDGFLQDTGVRVRRLLFLDRRSDQPVLAREFSQWPLPRTFTEGILKGKATAFLAQQIPRISV